MIYIMQCSHVLHWTLPALYLVVCSPAHLPNESPSLRATEQSPHPYQCPIFTSTPFPSLRFFLFSYTWGFKHYITSVMQCFNLFGSVIFLDFTANELIKVDCLRTRLIFSHFFGLCERCSVSWIYIISYVIDLLYLVRYALSFSCFIVYWRK